MVDCKKKYLIAKEINYHLTLVAGNAFARDRLYSLGNASVNREKYDRPLSTDRFAQDFYIVVMAAGELRQ